MKNYSDEEVKYLSLLAKEFPTIQDVCTEIINLKAILNLPKATEHFLSDLHGEYESFLHILKNASGVIKSKIDELYENSMTHSERKKLATLIYYPEEKLELIKKEEKELKEFYKITLYHLIEVCKMLSSKYSRSKVRKAMPSGYEYILDEFQNLGLGRKMAIECMKELLKLGYTELISACLDGNPSNEFHKSLGGVLVNQIEFEPLGVHVGLENIYYYKNLESILESNIEKEKNKELRK